VAVACFDGGWGWCSFSEEVAWLGCRSSSVAGLRRPRNRKWRRWEGRLHVQLEVDNGADWSSKRLEPAAASDRCLAIGAGGRRRRGAARSGGLGCFGPQMGVGIRWRAATSAWRVVHDMDAVWEKNSSTWARLGSNGNENDGRARMSAEKWI
jgi:hypothetical protein